VVNFFRVKRSSCFFKWGLCCRWERLHPLLAVLCCALAEISRCYIRPGIFNSCDRAGYWY